MAPSVRTFWPWATPIARHTRLLPPVQKNAKMYVVDCALSVAYYLTPLFTARKLVSALSLPSCPLSTPINSLPLAFFSLSS